MEKSITCNMRSYVLPVASIFVVCLIVASLAQDTIDSVSKYRLSLDSYLREYMKASNAKLLARLKSWQADTKISGSSRIAPEILEMHDSLISLDQEVNEERCGSKSLDLVNKLQPLTDSMQGYFKTDLDILLTNIISKHARACLPLNTEELNQIESELSQRGGNVLLDINYMHEELDPFASIISYHGSNSFHWRPTYYTSAKGIMNAAREHIDDDKDVQVILIRSVKNVCPTRVERVFEKYGVQPCMVYYDAMEPLMKTVRLNTLSPVLEFDGKLEDAVIKFMNCELILTNRAGVLDALKVVINSQTGKKIKSPSMLSQAWGAMQTCIN